jgi:kojibiose phosphorylase
MKTLEKKGFSRNDVILAGTRYLIGNGYFGYRGTLDEFTKAEMVALNLNGIYDQQGDLWRESVNAFNPLYTFVRVKDVELNPNRIKPLSHVTGLDITQGLFYRETTYRLKEGDITIKSERFADQRNRELLYSQFTIKASHPIVVDLFTGIDLDIYNLSGSHLETEEIIDEVDFFFVKALTKELGKPIVVGETTTRNFKHQGKVMIQNQKALRHYSINMESDKEYTLQKFTGVVHSRKDSYDYLDMLVTKAQKMGYARKKQENSEFWDDKWALARVELVGEEDIETGVNYSIYQLISARPYADHVSIPARGLSGQIYKGAVFWDTEIFMLPFFLNTDPESARHIIMYRILGLKGAKEKAAHYGYEGAFYAWESQEDGVDACSDFNVTDAITGEPIRTYFKEKLIHINGAIVYALMQYLERTGDETVLFAGGIEMVLECARFYLSYITYDKESHQNHVPSVIGPDEYHELVTDNAYTNYMIHYVFDTVFTIMDQARKNHSRKVSAMIKENNWAELIRQIRSAKEKLYLPEPNDSNIIEQFQGYFSLEDVSVSELKQRLRHPNEYLGGTNGLATPTKVIKQADVVCLMALFPERFTRVVKKANFAYYEPKTEHGSSLSRAMHALAACDIGRPNYAYPHFVGSALIDIKGEGKQFAGGIYIGGSHLAACGGTYLALVYGFCGLKHFGHLLTCDTRLSSKIKDVKFKVLVRGKIANIRVTNMTATVTWEEPEA